MKSNRNELVESLIQKMVCTMKSLHNGNDFVCGEFKLSRPQIMVLFFVAKKNDGVSAKELAAFLNVTSGAITQFIDVLVDKKLVVREEDSNDRRILRIKLTASTKKKIAAYKKDYYTAVSPAFDNLSEVEIRSFVELLNKIKI